MKTFFWRLFIFLSIAGCSGGDPSISVLPSTESFSQGESFNLKLDILWVVDPSRSMFEETERVKANISSFMGDIVESGYEYRVGVISTAAWSELSYQADNQKTYLRYNGEPIFAKLHKGECVDYSGSQAANPYLSYLSESNLGSFLTKFDSYFDIYGAQVSTSGCGLVGPPFGNFEPVSNNFFGDGRFDSNQRSQIWQYANDERPLQSMKTYLEGASASQFLREDAYLAVILITDEPDGSQDSLQPSLSFDQSQGGGHSANLYLDFLDQLKGSRDKYGVYSIIKTDGTNNLDRDVALASGGQVVDIDGSSESYKENLKGIKNAILKASSVYPISSPDPIPESFVVKIIKSDGTIVTVPRDTGSGGFEYVAGLNGLQFTVPYVPDKGDSIEVQYDKSSLASGEASLPFIRLSENSFSEGESNGYKVGKLSLGNADVQDASYTILSDSSDPDDSGPMAGAFSINTSTWEIELSNSSLIDKESQALHSLRLRASSAKYGDIERDITLIISDVIDAVPVAAADVYRRSERIVDSSGNITINGNLSFNDSGIDTSEVHTYTLNAPATEGLFQLNSDGSFTYTVAQADLSLTSGQSHVENLSYTLEDQSSNQSQANITITIDGANEAPILYQAINDQTVNITGGEQLVSIDSSSISASGSGSGSYADLVDGNNGTVFTTAAGTGQAHHIELPFSGTSYFEVSRIEIDGNHPVGNSVFQILSDSDDVLTREVLEIDNGSSLNVDFSTAVIGKKIKMIRPTGAVNSLGDDNIQIQEFRVYGFEVSLLTIDLLNHFSDADGDNLTFHVTDKFGEGPAPGWITIAGSGNQINAIPPAGADVEVGVLAADPSGDSAFTVFRITRTGGASSVNGPPIALLDIDDSQRGGLSLTRWGGNAPGTTFPDRVTHDEADEFLDQVLDESGVLIPYAFPTDFDGVSTSDGHGRLADGWNLTPSFENNKYARNGRLIPYINSEREYGEFYSGYFVPAKTGIYRFRTTTLDDVLRLLISPSEYFSDLEKIISGTIDTASMRRVMADTVRDQGASVGVLATYDLGGDEITNCRGTEFFVGQACGGPHDTSRFFQGGRAGYQHGYVFLEKGNVYATQVRFMEGGGSVAFDFEYDYKASSSSPWEGWKAIDASVVIPKTGADAYSNRLISASGSVNFDSSNLFYDSEQDILEYSARLVLPDGSAFVGPGQTSDVSEIGLSINISSGLLTGSLNSVYANAPVKPRIEFKASEKFSTVEKSATSLAIKLAP